VSCERVLRLRIEERPPIRRVAANILNKQSRTADEGWSSSLGGWNGSKGPFLDVYDDDVDLREQKKVIGR